MSHHKALGFLGGKKSPGSLFKYLGNKEPALVNTQRAFEYRGTHVHLGESVSCGTAGNLCSSSWVNSMAALCLSHRAKDQASLQEVWHRVATWMFHQVQWSPVCLERKVIWVSSFNLLLRSLPKNPPSPLHVASNRQQTRPTLSNLGLHRMSPFLSWRQSWVMQTLTDGGTTAFGAWLYRLSSLNII